MASSSAIFFFSPFARESQVASKTPKKMQLSRRACITQCCQLVITQLQLCSITASWRKSTHGTNENNSLIVALGNVIAYMLVSEKGERRLQGNQFPWHANRWETILMRFSCKEWYIVQTPDAVTIIYSTLGMRARKRQEFFGQNPVHIPVVHPLYRGKGSNEEARKEKNMRTEERNGTHWRGKISVPG